MGDASTPPSGLAAVEDVFSQIASAYGGSETSPCSIFFHTASTRNRSDANRPPSGLAEMEDPQTTPPARPASIRTPHISKAEAGFYPLPSGTVGSSQQRPKHLWAGMRTRFVDAAPPIAFPRGEA